MVRVKSAGGRGEGGGYAQLALCKGEPVLAGHAVYVDAVDEAGGEFLASLGEVLAEEVCVGAVARGRVQRVEREVCVAWERELVERQCRQLLHCLGLRKRHARARPGHLAQAVADEQDKVDQVLERSAHAVAAVCQHATPTLAHTHTHTHRRQEGRTHARTHARTAPEERGGGGWDVHGQRGP